MLLNSRHLILPGSLLIAFSVAMGCTSSEPYMAPPATGSGGSTGSGGMTGSGSGGMTAAGSGGMTAAGSGGMTAAGSGGMTVDAGGGNDTGPADMGGGADMGAGLTFAKDVQPVLMRVCGGCHGAAGGMNVSMMTGATGVLGPISTAHMACAKSDTMKRRVSPGDPANSFLYAKITTATGTSVGANCGNGMPANANTMLTAAEKTMIQSWIMQGAK